METIDETPKARRAPWWIGIGLVAALALVAAVLFATGVFDDEDGKGGDSLADTTPYGVPVLKAGDCFDFFEFTDPSRALPQAEVPCKQPHDGETFAVVTVEDTAQFPGSGRLEQIAVERCAALADTYTQGTWSSSTPALTVKYFHPTEAAWVMDGTRHITCAFRAESGEKLTGSVRRK